MARSKDIKVEGLKDLEKALRELGKEFGNPKYAVQAMRPAVKAAMNVEEKIEENTPIDSGGLKESVTTKIGKATKKIKKSNHFNDNTIIVGRSGYFWKKGESRWNQALAVEFGNEKTSASAPLRNAFDEEHAGMLQRFKDTLGPAIEKKGKSLNKKRGKK